MIPLIMQAPDTPKEFLIEQKVQWNAKGHLWYTWSGVRQGVEFGPLNKFQIRRYLERDLYSAKFWPCLKPENTTSGVLQSALYSVNNGPVTEGGVLSEKTTFEDAKWIAHHSAFDDMKFNRTSVFMAQMGNGLNNPWSRVVLYPKMSIFNHSVSVPFDTVIKVKTLKQATFELKPESFSAYAGSFSEYPTDFTNSLKVEEEFNNIMIEPIIPKYGVTDEVVANIYMYNTGNIIHQYDLDIQNATFHSTGLGQKGLRLFFEPISVPSRNKGLYNLVGELKIMDHTHYDYQTGKVKVELHGESKKGDLVPFNHVGNYTRIISLDLNDVYKDMHFAFSTNIDQPLLNYIDGLVRLEINELNNDPRIEKEFSLLTKNAIELIKEDSPSLYGIKNVSEIYFED